MMLKSENITVGMWFRTLYSVERAMELSFRRERISAPQRRGKTYHIGFSELRYVVDFVASSVRLYLYPCQQEERRLTVYATKSL